MLSPELPEHLPQTARANIYMRATQFSCSIFQRSTGKMVFIDRDDLLAFLEACNHPPALIDLD